MRVPRAQAARAARAGNRSARRTGRDVHTHLKAPSAHASSPRLDVGRRRRGRAGRRAIRLQKAVKSTSDRACSRRAVSRRGRPPNPSGRAPNAIVDARKAQRRDGELPRSYSRSAVNNRRNAASSEGGRGLLVPVVCDAQHRQQRWLVRRAHATPSGAVTDAARTSENPQRYELTVSGRSSCRASVRLRSSRSGPDRGLAPAPVSCSKRTGRTRTRCGLQTRGRGTAQRPHRLARAAVRNYRLTSTAHVSLGAARRSPAPVRRGVVASVTSRPGASRDELARQRPVAVQRTPAASAHRYR